MFCLTDEWTLLTFDRESGKKINEIGLDHAEHSVILDETLNPQILKNDKFIMGIDPLNGDQLWKIKEVEKDNSLQMKLYEKKSACCSRNGR